jgi:hypothetical protein
MAFRGPSRSYGLGPGGDYELVRQSQNDEFAHALELASQAQSMGRDFGQSVARDQANQTAMEAGRARLAMTPGIRAGGSTATAVNMIPATSATGNSTSINTTNANATRSASYANAAIYSCKS